MDEVEVKTTELLGITKEAMNKQNSWVAGLFTSLVSLQGEVESLNSKCSIILGILISLLFMLFNIKFLKEV